METRTDKIVFSFLMVIAISTLIYVAFAAFEESSTVMYDYPLSDVECELAEQGFISENMYESSDPDLYSM